MNQKLNAARAVLQRHSRVVDAAKEIGVSRYTLRDWFQQVGETASQWLGAAAVPEGHRVKGNSTLVGREGELVQQWRKTEIDSDEEPRFLPVPPEHTVKRTSTLLGAQGEVRAQWVSAAKDEATQWQGFWDACEAATARYDGLRDPTPAPEVDHDRLLTAYPLGDPHLGMLAWARETGADFDVKIAEQNLLDVVSMLIDRSPSSKTGLLVNVGDYFHAEDDTQRTPGSGHKLDVDTRATKIAEIGFSVMERMIDLMLAKHEIVRVVNAPGNHDPKGARMMNMFLHALYRREPRVEVMDNANPYIYLRHGKVLLGITHGDGPKPEALPGIMAADRPQDWGETLDRYWLTGHIHHLTRKEYTGNVVVESFRSLAPRDYWHHAKGYRSGQSLCSISYHEEYGEDVRITVPLRRAA